MRVQERPLGQVIPYEGNPRVNDDAVPKVAESIREFGWQQPIVVDADGVIIAGHTRYKAAQALGLATVPVVVADNLTAEQVQAYRLADNRTAELAEWDDSLLAEELDGLLDFDMERFGFDSLELAGALDYTDDAPVEGEPADDEEQALSLAERFGIPPFSVFDARSGTWQERKRAWLSLGIKSELGRGGGGGSQPHPGAARCLSTEADVSHRRGGDGL